MGTYYYSYEALSVVLVISTSLYVLRNFQDNDKRLPPGPKGVPILGNLFQLSMTVWVEFEKWKKRYGPLVYINVAGQGMLILNTQKAAADLLDRRGNLYSSRPRWIVASDIFTGGLMIVLAKQTDVWRRMRRAGHEGLNKAKSETFHILHQNEALITTGNLLRDINDWESEYKRCAASSIMSLIYDKPAISSCDDPSIAKIDDFVHRLTLAVFPGSHLVEFFNWMEFIPSSIAGWKRRAENGFKIFSEFFEGLYHEVEDRIKDDDDRPSFTGTLIREKERHNLSDRESAWLSATMYAAGTETSSAVMSWFILAMIAYPEVQRRCQAELDTVVGRSRAPTFEDRKNLPYIIATVREALRWRPVLPLGVHHYTTEDDWYEGYFIPKGTVCLANIWSINRDPEVYGSDADHFNPERFLDETGQLKSAPPDTREGHATYGFGPRICVGRHVANNALFMNIATLLWAANITPSKDESGNSVIPDVFKTVSSGMAMRPPGFKCSITYRFPEAGEIISHTKELID